jgi:type I restriction enzyme S subunit
MNAERLLAQFERISEAPDAIARLRRFILDLAVRGKLVEQDPEDEPAEELLGRILELKIRSAGKLPKSDLQLIDRLFNDEPFALPDSWTWVVLGQITDLITSGSRDWAKHYSDSGAIFVRMGNLVKGDYRLRLDSIQHVSPPAGGEGTRTRLDAWDVLVSITGDVGMLGLIPEGFGEAYINQHTALARPCFLLKGRYLPEFLRSDFAQNQFQEPQRGIKNSFRLSDLSAIVVPLPPLAEQHRIVAKVDELMALCDQLEAARQERQECRERLVAATLQRLNQPAEDPASFRQDASFALEVLPNLTTTSAQIKQLRQTILNLAVRGKLVEQDPEDEPAVDLIRKISEEKPALLAKGGFRSFDGKLNRDGCAFIFGIPSTWEWCFLDDISAIGRGGSPRPIQAFITDSQESMPWIKISDSSRGSVYINNTQERITLAGVSRSRIVVPGDLLLSNSMSFGFPYISMIEGCIHDGWLVIRTPEGLINKLYLRLLLLSDHARAAFAIAASGAVVQNLNADKVRQLAIPLPPLAEQHRIVAKVDELMVLCDQLEQQLNQADQQRRRLLEAVLAEALLGPEKTLEAAYA